MTVQINIIGLTFDVEVTDKPIINGGDVCYGLCQNDKRLITLEAGRPPEAIMQTFIHEVIHAIDYQIGRCTDETDALTENQVNRIALGLTGFLLNNPMEKIDSIIR